MSIDDIASLFLKGLSQVLILVGGIWALLSDTYEIKPTSGRRQLTRGSWMKVSILAVGFILFVMTEFQNHSRHKADIKWRDDELEDRKMQIEYLRRLFLLQHEISGIEVSWTLSSEDVKNLATSLRRYAKKVEIPIQREAEFNCIVDALHTGWLHILHATGSGFLMYGSKGETNVIPTPNNSR